MSHRNSNHRPPFVPPRMARFVRPIARAIDRLEHSGERRQLSSAGAPGSRIPSAGRFRYWFADDEWEWSDELALIHGYEPGTVAPTTDLLRSHKHPVDRIAFDRLVAEMRDTHVPFSSRHRIVDRHGTEREVLVVGTSIQAAGGEVVGTEGYYLRVTDTGDDAMNSPTHHYVGGLLATEAVVEQAEGMLMAVYGIDAERAFDVLRWRSETAEVPLLELCESLIDEVAYGAVAVSEEARRQFDLVVLSGATQPDAVRDRSPGHDH